jgi:hypothetical protein
MSSLPKRESMGTKLVALFANRVVKRINRINDYLRGRVCIEIVRGSFEFLFALFLDLPLFVTFVGFYGFPLSR